MIEMYKKVVFENYANFNGRAGRAEYWWFILANLIISVVLGFIFGALKMPLITNIYSLAVLLPSIGVAVRRVHDSGKSGWFVLVPFYNIYLVIIEGDRGSNEYGPNPEFNHDELNEIGTKN